MEKDIENDNSCSSNHFAGKVKLDDLMNEVRNAYLR